MPTLPFKPNLRLVFLLACEIFACTLLAAGSASAAPLTAQQVIDRIKAQAGGSWQGATVDTFKAGDPNTPVTGIATTFMSTLDVLQRAAASGKNLIITHEPTFYNHLDKLDDLQGDPVVEAKLEFIRQHHLVIWRFHDHFHLPNHDGIMHGMTDALGWQERRNPADEHLFTFPPTTVRDMAGDIKHRLDIRTLRVVGDPTLKITKVGFLPGASGSAKQIKMLERPEVEALLIGEAPEWETISYVRDAVAQRKHKALIILGHTVSEEAGMRYCAQWLKAFIPETPIEFIPAGEPFWTPK
jgi:putative NIF3 family GTP cyclohydrolase 1 type 2